MIRLAILVTLLLAATTPAGAGPLAAAADAASADLVAAIRPAVVRVEGIGRGGRRMPSAGVILDPGRIVLTWSGMAARGWEAVVVLPGGERRRGEVTARDPETGVTVVRVESPLHGGLMPASDVPGPGSPVLSAGHAFGTKRADGGPAVSLGVLAQVRRSGTGGTALRYVLSTASNPGDYGGPLVDRTGRLAGILLAESDAGSRLSRALPIPVLREKLGEDPLVARALAPRAPAGEGGEWPVHDALVGAVRSVSTSVASLVVQSASGGGTVRNVTGVLVDDEGHVVTTVANLEDAGMIAAVFPDGREYEARVLARDERIGIAVLRLAGEEFPAPATPGTEEPRVGRFVAAVGNPNGREQRHGPLVTVGLVGARNRSDRRYGALHTDAAVNGSNAGGALVDIDGNLVGILTTMGGLSLSLYGANSGIGFAIPIGDVVERLPVLTRGESIEWRPGYLGVNLDRDADVVGVRIEEIREGEAAEAAGIRAGDVIVGANGQAIENMEDLRRIFSEFEVDEEIEIALERDGEPLAVTAKLGAWPGPGPR